MNKVKDTMQKITFLVGIIGLILWGYLSTLAQDDSCPADYEGFLAPRLQVGTRGMVAPGGSGNRVRTNPSTSGDQVGTMPPGTELEVIDGPRCDSSASIIWWQVVTDDGLQGWTAEGLPPDEYFLVPLLPPGITATPTPTPSPRPTSTPTITPTAIQLPALDLPNLGVLSPENVTQMDVVGQFPTTGRAVSLFLSPDMAYLFVVSLGQYGANFANVYTFPDLRPVMQGLPLYGTNGNGYRGTKPDGLFTPDGRLMVAVDFNDEDVRYYTPGEASYVTYTEALHYSDEVALSDTGILAVSFSILSSDGRRYEQQLCFMDVLGDRYAPDHRLCVPQESAALVFLSDGMRLLNGSADELTLYNALSGEILQTFHYGIGRGGTLAVLPGTDARDSLPTVFISKEGFVLSVNLETGAERTYPSGAGLMARQIIVHPGGSQMMFIVPTTDIPDVLVVDIAIKALLHRNVLYGGETAAYSPDGTLAYINNELYETASWEMLDKLRGDQHIITFSPDGTMLFVLNTTDQVFEIYGVPNA